MYDSLYNLSMAEDSIDPLKYRVEGYPPIHSFPANHPNRKDNSSANKENIGTGNAKNEL